VRYLREVLIDETPSITGGRNEISAIRLHHDITWLSSVCPMSAPDEITGVHEARISISDSLLRGESLPKEALETRVTVPEGEL
jgi:hypothetical protein